MSFLMGSLLIGLAAAAIPVVIHLLHRQRTVPVPWGAMQFLLASQLQSRRRRTVEHWLLLLARVALLALLAFLLARPLLVEGRYNPLSPDAATDVAVVIDHSLSTGRKAAGGAGQTVFQQSLAAFDDLAKSMRPNDTLTVVLAEHRPDASLTPLPIRSGGARDARAALSRLAPGMTRASIPDAVQAAREQLRRGPNAQKAIVVLSDEQSQGWHAEDAGAWRAAAGADAPHLFSVPVPPEPERPNVTVGGITVEPGLVGPNRPAQITSTLTAAGPADATFGAVSAALVVSGKEVSRQSVPDLKPGQSRTVRFDHVFTDPGSSWFKVQLDADDVLDADDSAVSAVEVWERLPVLVIDGQLTAAGTFRASQFLAAAMQPAADAAQEAASLVRPKVVSASAADTEKLEDYAAVVVNDVPQISAAVIDKLSTYARSGGGVWVILGPRTDEALVERQLAQAGLLAADVREKRSPATPAAVELKAADSPMVALLAAAGRNAMTGAATKQWWALSPKGGDEQVVLAAAGTGDPLVLERPVGRAGGRVVVWCTSADGAWNNWPRMPNFVPLVNETVYHLASARTHAAGNRRLEAGVPIEWTGPPEPRVKSASITRPDGKVVQKQPTLSNGRQRLSYNDTDVPGLYTLRFDPTDVPQPAYFGVGVDRRELDAASLTEADYAWLSARGFVHRRITPAELPSVLGGATGGVELWKWLGAGVLALLVFETVMTRRMVRLQESPAPAAAPVAHAA